MQWNILIGPAIGAVIGYVTNLIAVQMLFHPINPVYIGKYRVPFTPGIIPRGKARFAKAIGNVVGNNLLNPVIIKDTLLSPDKEQEIRKQLDLIFQKLSDDDTTLEVRLNSMIGDSAQTKLESDLVVNLTQKISTELITMNLGQIIAAEVKSAVVEKVQGTMLAMFLNPTVLEPIENAIGERVNRYIEEHAEEKVNSLIQNEYTKLNQQTISSFMSQINTAELKDTILKVYRLLITEYSEKILSSLNLSRIAEEKVNAMDTKEVEELVLTIMKKELGAVVNLGAVIGFILGLINLFF
ncbi:DUF445 domain-containing protein [Anaerocolumna sp. MB42-C2]|uniref:DUF445 domain-containing protein n=1 Tax=Anaerocolumna sp. MB42-C2 TaxID=3070997 RepID=UPI0027E12476|nr:DUF445 family protein [Anaerocolumna sp. MB42-C2]WMJ88194.1 DUF445 family protein [Anaerocolumna sp. MB42-C2]